MSVQQPPTNQERALARLPLERRIVSVSLAISWIHTNPWNCSESRVIGRLFPVQQPSKPFITVNNAAFRSHPTSSTMDLRSHGSCKQLRSRRFYFQVAPAYMAHTNGSQLVLTVYCIHVCKHQSCRCQCSRNSQATLSKLTKHTYKLKVKKKATPNNVIVSGPF